jgi:hypothetical protein
MDNFRPDVLSSTNEGMVMALPLIGFFTGGLFAKVIAFVLASTVLRVVTAVGFAVVTYTGIDLLFDQIETEINSHVAALPSDMYQVLDIFGFIFTIQMMLSTFTAIIAIKSLQSLKRGVFK